MLVTDADNLQSTTAGVLLKQAWLSVQSVNAQVLTMPGC